MVRVQSSKMVYRSVPLPRELSDLFTRTYPNCFARFVRLCALKAVKDKSFFTSVYIGGEDGL